jgi:hypothetical protein
MNKEQIQEKFVQTKYGIKKTWGKILVLISKRLRI